MNSSIVVIGSSNTDMVIKTDKFPLPGETLLGGEFLMNPGGKGANQAVAAARLGGDIVFIARVGNDIFGEQALQQFSAAGIHTHQIIKDTDHPSGVALITVDVAGENTIVVAPGANGALNEADIAAAETSIATADILLMQLEIPINTVAAAASIAKFHNTKIILNPAPAAALPDEILNGLYLITPNEIETETLTGIAVTDFASAEKAAKILKEKGVQNVIITAGAAGAYIFSQISTQQVPAPQVKAVDTTAAGDVFNGALAVAISEGKDLPEAVDFACRAAAISVTRMGAQASAPTRAELQPVAVT